MKTHTKLVPLLGLIALAFAGPASAQEQVVKIGHSGPLSGPNAFAGKEKPVARILDAWAEDAIHNADLTFSTAAAARRAPQLLDEMRLLDQATGVVCAERGVNQEQARSIIADAAYRAGQDQVAVAREMLQPFLRDDD